MARSRVLTVSLILLVVAGAAWPRARKKSSVAFDYFLLTLSWAPDFCAAPGGTKDPLECGPGRKLGFIVHGLWPQGDTTRGPENCGGVSPVPAATVNIMLKYMPGKSLIQHEWTTHGSCSGLGSDAYFADIRKARDAVKIPPELGSLAQSVKESPAQVEGQFAAANPGYPKTAFRATCTNGELQEMRICLDKNLKPRACTASAGACQTSAITILPPR